MYSAIASFGLWPAVPLSGYWLFVRYGSASRTSAFPPVTFCALLTVVGITVWSVPMLAAAVAGVYQAKYFGLLGWAVTLVALAKLLKRREVFWQESLRLSAWDWVLAVGLLVVAGLYLGFPTESILGGRDQGVYANYGIYIAHHGRLDVPYPWQGNAGPIFFQAFQRLPGFDPGASTMRLQWAPLFPVWLAQAFSTFGHHGLFRLNAVFALLFLGIFYGLCRSVVPQPYAVVATLFLALNPSELWLARITLTEICTQLFIWSGLLLLLHALKDENRVLARWAGVFLGFSALLRIDSLFLIPLLFLSHLALKIVAEPTTQRTFSVWPAFYQTALSVLILAVNYYVFFCLHYVFDLFTPLRQIGFFSVASLFPLLAATPSIVKLVRPWLTGKTSVVCLGLVLFVFTAYAYWIRPSMEPYATISRPGHFLHGTRSYRENSLVNLAQYLSPFVVWIAVFGWFFALWAMMQEKRNLHLVPGLLVIAGFSALYLWHPSIAPDHFWAIRRFVPIVIPGFIFFAAFGLWWMLGRFAKGWSLTAAGLALLFLSVFTVKADSLIFAFAENKGYFMQLQQLAEKLPRDEIIVTHDASDWALWATPLYVAFDRKAVPLDLDTADGRNAFDNWIARQTTEQKPVYLLYEGNMRIIGLENNKLDEVFLSRDYSELTVNPLPRRVLHERIRVSLYKVMGAAKSADYLNIALGSETVWGVEESGFHGQEWSGNQPIRWTTGTAQLVVPVDEQRPPQALRVDLASTGPRGTRLRVLANGRELSNERIPSGGWSKTFSLTGIALGKRVAIELLSDTFVPKDTIKGSTDPRSLGVYVRGISLLESDSAPQG